MHMDPGPTEGHDFFLKQYSYREDRPGILPPAKVTILGIVFVAAWIRDTPAAAMPMERNTVRTALHDVWNGYFSYPYNK